MTDKLNLKNQSKNIGLVILSIYYNWTNIKSEYNNNKFKIYVSTWNDAFDLPDGSYSKWWYSGLVWIHYYKTWNFKWRSTKWNLSK